MASTTKIERPPIGLAVLMLVAVLVIGFLATQWLVGLVLGLIRLALILIGFFLVAKVGLYLLRQGR